MFNRIVIVGVGLIGGSLGLAFRRRYHESTIVGVSSPGTVKTAVNMGAIIEGYGYGELGRAVENADLVILSTPIHRIRDLLPLLGPLLRPGVLVTDVGSTKREITDHASRVLPAGVHFIGGHPMTGSEKRGVAASDPFLFQNAMYVLTPAGGVPGEVIDRFTEFITGIGARVVLMEASLHDRIAAAVSHLPQMIAISLVNLVGEKSSDSAPYLQLAAGGFRDMTRIASSPFTMWDDICRTNRDAILDAIDEFIDRLINMRDRIGTPALGEDFDDANTTRAAIPKDTKGFVHALSEVLVVVEDRPGVIARIATTLADENINIKDIEVMKVREGEGGHYPPRIRTNGGSPAGCRTPCGDGLLVAVEGLDATRHSLIKSPPRFSGCPRGPADCALCVVVRDAGARAGETH
ncbi:prephenate dehydrogenase/arogenate dehydrogenase family protein [Candidatus Latescibacterota bacterium]